MQGAERPRPSKPARIIFFAPSQPQSENSFVGSGRREVRIPLCQRVAANALRRELLGHETSQRGPWNQFDKSF